MNKRQIIASLIKIANELDMNNMHDEADALTNVAERFEDKRTPVEKLASEKIKAMQDKLRQIIYKSYKESRDGEIVRPDDIQAVLLKLLSFEQDTVELSRFLREESYKTGASFPEGQIGELVYYISKLKENPFESTDIYKFIDSMLN